MMAQWDFQAKIEELVDANDQFHWGQNPDVLERAAEVLRVHNLNLMGTSKNSSMPKPRQVFTRA